ncbi:hypothetical protein CEXT_352501 [Caerostris extrusa]|uniref:Uncharacterized protein n=1 Tax=Caerostris extrusa TaxID=172846 RepID=A0AAV4N9E3_CAEEX|nr:hypothetical protein CEXT_352501 [Caerostris extrusa]
MYSAIIPALCSDKPDTGGNKHHCKLCRTYSFFPFHFDDGPTSAGLSPVPAAPKLSQAHALKPHKNQNLNCMSKAPPRAPISKQHLFPRSLSSLCARIISLL